MGSGGLTNKIVQMRYDYQNGSALPAQSMKYQKPIEFDDITEVNEVLTCVILP